METISVDPFAIPVPNWAEWSIKSHLPLWLAITLACNICPNRYLANGERLPPGMFLPIKAFDDLMAMAKSAIGNNGILRPMTLHPSDIEFSQVRMDNFTAWLMSFKFDLPIGYPWAPEAPDFGALNWPWGRHSTKSLRLLAEAAERFWKHYDPDDATTAPTNEQVSSWLHANGASKRNSEVMASILRADGLPIGPRK